MSDPDKPPRKGGFQPGNKFGKGRPKGSSNKFGPDLRAKLLAGIAASGVRKAKRAGVNGKVDGTAFFVEALMENTAAASALLSKLIPPEPPAPAFTGPGVIINVHAAGEGQIFLPGNEVLAPFEFAHEAWLAYNAGVESWKTYLETARGRFTAEAFENLSRVPPLERVKLALDEAPRLRLVPSEPTTVLETEALSPMEAELLAGLRGMTNKLLRAALSPAEARSLDELRVTTDELLHKYGLAPCSSGGDDAA